MGLDSVEVVVEVEKAFEIEIDDLEASRLITVGSMVDYIWLNAGLKESNTPVIQILLDKTKTFLCELRGGKSLLLGLNTLLKDLFSPQEFDDFINVLPLNNYKNYFKKSFTFFDYSNNLNLKELLESLIKENVTRLCLFHKPPIK